MEMISTTHPGQSDKVLDEIGGYKVIIKLKSKGITQTYLVENIKDRTQRYAMKYLQLAGKELEGQNFEAMNLEAQVMDSVNHPFIVKSQQNIVSKTNG